MSAARGHAVLLLCALAACSRADRAPTQRSVTDGIGRHVALGTVRRVISLAPSSTEILYALDAGELLVGVDRFSDYPATVRALPQVGTDMEPSLERILALRPDLVLVATSANSQRSVETMTQAGAAVYVSRADSLEGIFADIQGIGRAIDRAARAEALVRSLRERVAALGQRARALPPTTCAVVVWPSPLVVAARGSHVGDLIAAAGGRDIVEDATQPFPTYSTERLIRESPAVLIVGSHSTAVPSLAPLQQLSSIPAVRDRRVHLVDGDLLFRPGPRVVDGIAALVPLLHPELGERAMIELAAVDFSYGARSIIAGLSLRVAAGELVGVLGPNGAGKSTLLRLALGLLPVQRGAVRIQGADLSTLPRRQIARRVAAMVQDEAPGFPLSVKDCVLLGRLAHLPAHGFESAADLSAAAAAMAEVGVTALADRSLHTLSGGERRRVLLARTLAQGAQALVLDEPAANLDLAHQLELFDLLRARATAGAAILVSVHDLNLALRACDRVLLLVPGAGAVIGRPDEILTEARVREVFAVEIERGRSADGKPYLVAVGPRAR